MEGRLLLGILERKIAEMDCINLAMSETTAIMIVEMDDLQRAQLKQVGRVCLEIQVIDINRRDLRSHLLL